MARHRFQLIATGALLLTATNVAAITAQRTFVSGSGVDNPDCSIVRPCRGFAAALTATTAGGEIIVLDSGGYGRLTITKSISIIAPPGIYAGVSVAAGFDGVTVNAPGATVVLRGLSINGLGGSGNGILVQQAGRIRIEGCVVSNMGAVGIYHRAPGAEMIVLDTIVRDTADTGLALAAASASIVLDHVRSEHNQFTGIYVAHVVGAMTVRAAIADSVFAQNGGNGIWADAFSGATTTILVERSLIAGNGLRGFYATAGAAGANEEITLARNSFVDNSSYAVHSLASLPSRATIHASDNAFTATQSIYNQVRAEGSGSTLFASTNNGNIVLSCFDSAFLASQGNNFGGGIIDDATCTVVRQGGS